MYTPAEAAFYARVPTQLMSRWLYGSSTGDAVFRPELYSTGERTVTFLDLVQAFWVRCIRQQHKIPLNKIRQAVDVATNKYGMPHPLAMQHTTYLFDDEIIINVANREAPEYVQMSGKHRHHRMLRQVVELYMKDLSFGDDGLANLYTAYSWSDRRILMDPARKFGEPYLPACGYSARTLWEACEAEGSIEAAADVYGVSKDDVEASWRYYDHLRGQTSA